MLPSGVIELISFLLGQTLTTGADLIANANTAVERVRELERDLDAPTSIAKRERETIMAETGVDADRNPYFRLADLPRMLACIVAAHAQGTRADLVLALWMKEATANVFTDVVLGGARAVTTADDAKAMFIAMNFFRFLGADLFTRFKPIRGGDNILLEEGRFAAEHRAILDRANSELMTLGVAKEDYAKAMRDNLTVTGGAGSAPFRVQAQGGFYPAMLGISHALFERLRMKDPLFDEFSFVYPLSDQLTYAIYNNGRGSKTTEDRGAYAFFKSNVRRANAEGRTLHDFLLHTQVVGKPWGGKDGPRRNLVRFHYFLKCYAPIFA